MPTHNKHYIRLKHNYTLDRVERIDLRNTEGMSL